MHRFYIFVFSLGLLFTTTSGFKNDNAGVTVGEAAPLAQIAHVIDNDIVLPSDGKSLVLNFWSATDGESRARAKRYAMQAENENVRVVNVNLSDNVNLYNAIVATDGLDAATSVRVDTIGADALRRLVGLGDSYGAVMVSDAGVVSAVNPELI